MDKNLTSKVSSIFKQYPVVKLAYIFGSQARGDTGPLSDYDFAIYTDEKDKKKSFDLKLELLNELTRILKTDAVDLVILDITKSPELKYNIIKEGKLIHEQEPYKVLTEPKILNQYFDFRQTLLKHNLTKNL